MTEHVDVAVVGGGQAGLAIGHHLARQGRRFTILEAAGELGAAWRARWDSLRLFTPVRYDSLPGLAFPGGADAYPSRDEVVAYLEDYVRHFELPVELDSRVLMVRDDGGGGFEVDLAHRSYHADQVVIATGPFQVPFTPPVAAGLDRAVIQWHSTGYRRPDQVPDGTVAVVGGGNTGYQIAEELVRSHEVHLAIGTRQTPVPQRLLGRDVFRYLDRLGVMAKTADTRIGRRMKAGDTLIGSSPRAARRQGIHLRPRVVAADGSTLGFADGTHQSVRTVIWATGFRLDHSFVRLPVLDAQGLPRHRRGVTDTPGLYFLGLPFQHTRGSALLGWVKDDARYIAERIAAHAAAAPAAPDPAAAEVPSART